VFGRILLLLVEEIHLQGGMGNMSKVLTMDELLAGSDINGLATGEVVEGTVTVVKKNEVWVDLGPRGVGVVLRREIGSASSIRKWKRVTRC
jgi:ribosomal protein S1